METATEPTSTAPITNIHIEHPEPRHIRLAMATMVATGNLTREAEHALRLAGAHYRATEQYSARGELHRQRDRHAETVLQLGRRLRQLEDQIESQKAINKELRRQIR